MRSTCTWLLPLVLLLSVHQLHAQSCIATGLNGTVINLPCGVNCAPLSFKVPHLKSTSDYSVLSVPYQPFSYTSPTSTEITEVYIDDKYSNLINLPFSFCFYDSIYSKCVVGSNGIITFDETQAGKNNAYTLYTSSGGPQPIPYSGGTPNLTSTTYYPPASIMGAYHDINPNAVGRPADRKIQYELIGTAPCRKLVVSYYNVPMFGTNCGNLICTEQMVLYESLGVIDVFLENKPICTSWTNVNPGLAILGVQNWQRDKAVAAPGKNCTQWTAVNEGYRFVPSGPVSRFIRAELLDFGGNVLATTGITPGADTSTTTAGLLNINFPQLCPSSTTSRYVVKTYFSACTGNTELVSADTVTVNKTTSLNATSVTTASACGPNGTIRVSIPAGVGTLPYSLSLDGGTAVYTNNQDYTFTDLIAGAHTVVVTTADGCAQTLNINVPSSGILRVTAAVTPTSCPGASNGSITINPQNGMAPFQYSFNLNAYQSSNTFTNLPAGTFLISVKDNSGCLLSNYQVQVTNGAGITATYAANPPSCPGAANGSITVTPTSGTAPYQYALNGGAYQPGNVFTNLATGTYILSIKDAQNCSSASISAAVGASAGSLTATLATTATSCSGVNNGSITINPTSGSGPYQYALNGGTFQSGTVITNLAPGNYSVVVKDNFGCTSSAIPATVSQGNALLANLTAAPTSCTGVSNGRITVVATNGSGPYTYSLDGGTPQGNNIFNNVAAGNHNIVVTDASGCVSAALPVNVTIGPAITGTVTSTPTTCAGAGNGTISVTPTTGSAPYQYSVDGGAFQNSNIFTSITSGPHDVIISDAAGCTSAIIQVNVAAGAPLTAQVTPASTSCNGATDGSITITPPAGLPPFQYALNGSAFQASNIFPNVVSGDHYVVVRDAAGCMTAQIPVTVVGGPPLSATINATPTSCSGAVNGTITVQPSSGNGPFQYSLDGTNFQAANLFTGLAQGSYTIIYKNNAGCQSSISTTIGPGQPLSATVAVNQVTCYGSNTGSIAVSISTMGAPPYQYSLDGATWQASSNFSGLTAGNYTVYFKDNNNCSGSQSFVVNQPSALSASLSTRPVVCNGQSNGNIQLTASGGALPYQYSLNGSSWQPANNFSVAAGNYTVYLRDNNNCILTQQAIITEPARLSATSSSTNATCDGGKNGTINALATGGTPGYQYAVNGGNFQSSGSFNLGQGNYILTVRDANGCLATHNETVGLTNNLFVIPVNDTTTCEGVGVQITPNTNATQFAWIPATGLDAADVPRPIATPKSSTQYIVAASLGVCTAYDTLMVQVNPAPVANAGPDGDICFGQTFRLQGSGGVSYDWSPRTYLNTSLAYDALVTPAQTIQYSLQVVDALGCRSLQPDVVTVHVTPPIQVSVSRDTVVAYGDRFQLHAASAAIDYTWSPAYGLNDPSKKDPLVTVTDDITYVVTASTPAGCKGEARVTLKVYQGPEIYVPDAFTPNGDGKNDVFRPFPVGIRSYTYFRVFNRWGQMIYSTSSFNQGWDGKIAGKEQPTGTYVWMVEGITKDDRKITKKGTVTLIR